MEERLPEGWIWTKLEDICIIIMGQSPPSSEYNNKGEGLPFFQGKAEFTDLYPTARKWCTSPTKIAETNDILLSVRAPVGPTNLAPSKCSIGRGLAAIRPEGSIEVRYILYAIRNFNSLLVDSATGTTFGAISGDDVRTFEIPLAPLPEQASIVATIEQQFTRLDNAVASLQGAKARVKQYRASLLKAAVEGELTKEWRATHSAEETGEQLLARILDERRARWEEEQLAEMRERGITPKDDKWKQAYKEPQEPDMEKLPELPEEWCWATFEQVSQRVTVGYVGSMAHEYLDSGIPFLRGQNVRPNRFDPNGLKYISPEFHRRIEKSALEAGDALVVRSGSVGIACVMPDLYQEANCSDLVIVKQPFINPHYAAYYMNSTAQKRVRSQQVGIALNHFNTQSMAALQLPLPPLAEQEQIVAEVEARLSNIAQMEATIEANLKQAEHERQSILREAFAGRLVPQNPEDEPASVLLEGIREERKQREEAEKVARASRKETQMEVAKKRWAGKASLYTALVEVGRPHYEHVLLEALEPPVEVLARVGEEEAVRQEQEAEQSEQTIDAPTLWDM